MKLLKLRCNSAVTPVNTPIYLSLNKICIYNRKKLQELQKTKLKFYAENTKSFFEKKSNEQQIQNKKKCNSCNSKFISALSCWFLKILQRLKELQKSYRGVAKERNSSLGVTETLEKIKMVG